MLTRVIPSDREGALNAGRVSHLFLPAEGDRSGGRLPDGELVESADESGAIEVPSLHEAMARRALDTSAQVSVVGESHIGEPIAATRW